MYIYLFIGIHVCTLVECIKPAQHRRPQMYTNTGVIWLER